MIRRILWILFIFMIVALVALWLYTGGASAVARTAHTFTNPVALIFGNGGSGSFITLPWQIGVPQGPDISSFAEGDDTGATPQTQEEYAAQNDALQARAEALRTFGNPSPYVGAITIRGSATAETDPGQEYVELDAARGNATPINITGWSLQSAVSGIRLFVPPAASPFLLGVLNNVAPVYLEPGTSAIVGSGTSLVGISFRENTCIGYLNELQHFTPELSSECPAPSDILKKNPDTLRIYGATCFDYVETNPQCHFPGASLPSNLSAPCRTLLANTLTYNGCVSSNRYRSDFALPEWRLYLNAQGEAWGNSHDIIRLLDSQGHTVDVFSY